MHVSSQADLRPSNFNHTSQIFTPDGWMDGWMDGWKDGWMDVWMDGWIDKTLCHHLANPHPRTGCNLYLKRSLKGIDVEITCI